MFKFRKKKMKDFVWAISEVAIMLCSSQFTYGVEYLVLCFNKCVPHQDAELKNVPLKS